ncbi:glycosyltransferase family 2 protein [Actinomyces vulturis]|uniref:glycosyltransferase family 2 protein n=1 Tax=Actinomyces vulturis TaxID=1857645 RepID=UPI000834DF7A|nr:glycosyltransferase family 2 protein [Actinomyces vulturis]
MKRYSHQVNTQPTVRIASVAYNPGPEFERFIVSLSAATSVQSRIVVADNGTEHDLVDRVCSEHGVTVLRDGMNHGYGAGINAALADSNEDIVVVANPDLVFEAGSIDRLIDALMSSSTVVGGDGHSLVQPIGCVGPCLLNTDGTVYPSARALPSLRLGVGHALFGHIWPSNPWTRRYKNSSVIPQFSSAVSTGHSSENKGFSNDAVWGHSPSVLLRAVGWLSGACVAMRREVWEELDGFDDRYFMFFEDVDLGRRIGEHGYLNVYVPDAVVWHEQGASWKKQPETMIRAHHDSARRYFADTHSSLLHAPLRFMINVGLRVRENLMVSLAKKSL